MFWKVGRLLALEDVLPSGWDERYMNMEFVHWGGEVLHLI